MTGPKGRVAGAPVLQLSLDAGRGVPLHRQVLEGLREAILAGRLAPGARLPSSRTLAADLGVARNTVLQAFDQLRSEGYVTGCRGGGTRVRPVIPDELLVVERRRTVRGGERSAGGAQTMMLASPRADVNAAGARVARRAAALTLRARTTPVDVTVPFQLGIPVVDAFPSRTWWRLAGRRWRRGAAELHGGDAAGEPELREAIAHHVMQARDAQCSADQVLVVNGAQQALHLIAQALLDPGQRVWLETPGYPGARDAFELGGAEVVPVPVDDEGLDIAEGERLAPDARVAYVTPSHQFPLGSVLSVERRLALLSWARRTGAWVVEDDYDSEFRYAGRPLASLQGMDAAPACSGGNARVVYVGTFSKTLAPALRLGYLIVPEPVVDAFRAVRAATDLHPPVATQRVLADFIGEGHHARHVRRVRAIAAERQALLVEAAEQRLGGLLEVRPNPAGLHVVGRLADGLSATEIARAAAADGVRVAPLARYCMTPHADAERHVLLGYAAFAAADIRNAADRLERVLRTLRSVESSS